LKGHDLRSGGGSLPPIELLKYFSKYQVNHQYTICNMAYHVLQ
jgi:hypothetical protein